MIDGVRQWETAAEKEEATYMVECPYCDEQCEQQALDVQKWRYHCPSCGSAIPQQRVYGDLP